MKRKYEDVKGYWVYSIQVPSINKYYIGVSKSKKCSKRWRKANYKDKSLAPYLNEWQDMIKTVLVDNLTKEQAYQYEGKIIDALSMNNLCINTNRSGLIKVSDINAYYREYMKQYRENNTEYHENHKQLCKQWRENNKEQEKQRVKQWYEDNKEKRREYMKQYRLKKKLEKQKQQMNLF